MKFVAACLLYTIMSIILFRVKNHVMVLESEERTVKRQMDTLKSDLHVLKAEWAYLNEPAQIQKLAAKYLPGMVPMNTNQILTKQKSLDDLLEKAIHS